ncbi:MAG: hypothetical protein JXA78_05285 [Anaerolineales bacterium]|nr:hypothetical protein [Anaerolineales bacterium]
MHANRLKDNGNYQEAAEIFERLARGAHDRGVLKRAPFLYLQAGQCCLLSSQAKRGIGLINQGLRLLEETQKWPALSKAGERSIAELRRSGNNQEADELQAWLDNVVKEHPEAKQEFSDTPGRGARRLPAKCPSCGASLRSDQVEWIDGDTAECIYCGSAVSTEG